MEISGNAFVSGLNAVQSGSARVAQAGSEIARNTVEARSPQAEQMVDLGMSSFMAMLGGAASGLVEQLFAVLCAWLVGLSALLLPWGLAAAAGAMLFVVTHEIIPESHRQGHAAEATLGLVFGFCLMMVLDTALG